jgi:putative ABC transport system permease protein
MGLWLTLRVAMRALLKKKMRASLTVLGVVIGIAAVTTMVSIGQSASRLVQGQIEGIGVNMLVIFPGSRQQHGARQGRGTMVSLTAQDAEALPRECPTILVSSPLVFASGQVIYGNSNWSPRELVGVGVDYLTVRNWEIRLGENFTERDVRSAAKVCIIGQTIAEKVFQTVDPVGKTLRVKNLPLRVVGVLKAKGANMVGDDQDNVLVAPYTTMRKRLLGSAFDNVDLILASARSPDLAADARREVRMLLRSRHRIRPGATADFEVQDTTEMASMLGVVTGVMTLLLASIAAISLVVGGVGIMNIMLVSVTERTREIGIRLAVGARTGDILVQFLVEAILLSAVGGVVGVAMGITASVGVTMTLNVLMPSTHWPTVISLQTAAIAVVFAGAVGMFFGFYPALRASRLDPIEALRYE